MHVVVSEPTVILGAITTEYGVPPLMVVTVPEVVAPAEAGTAGAVAPPTVLAPFPPTTVVVIPDIEAPVGNVPDVH